MIHERWASPEEAGGSLVGGARLGGYIFGRAKGVLMCPMMPVRVDNTGACKVPREIALAAAHTPETAGAAPFSGRARAACDTV